MNTYTLAIARSSQFRLAGKYTQVELNHMDYHKSHCPLQTFWGDEFQNAIIVPIIATAVTVASTALAAAALPALPALEASAEVMSAVGPLDDGAGQTMRAVPPAAAAEQRVLAEEQNPVRPAGGTARPAAARSCLRPDII